MRYIKTFENLNNEIFDTFENSVKLVEKVLNVFNIDYEIYFSKKSHKFYRAFIIKRKNNSNTGITIKKDKITSNVIVYHSHTDKVFNSVEELKNFIIKELPDVIDSSNYVKQLSNLKKFENLENGEFDNFSNSIKIIRKGLRTLGIDFEEKYVSTGDSGDETYTIEQYSHRFNLGKEKEIEVEVSGNSYSSDILILVTGGIEKDFKNMEELGKFLMDNYPNLIDISGQLKQLNN